MSVHGAAKVFSNPRASLLGLPTELRLEIYSYLVEPARFHIDEQDHAQEWELKRLRPCYTPDPTHPSLCAKPCFSGLSPSETLCHNIGGPRSHRLAIRQVCALFHRETSSILGKNWIGLIVVQRTHEVERVLMSMTAQQLEMLVDLTVQVLPVPGYEYRGISPVVVHLRRNHAALPNLRTLAIQTLQRVRNRSQSRRFSDHDFDPELLWRWQWFIVELKEIFQDRVQIIFEGWVVLRAGHRLHNSAHDEMMRIRGVVGNCNCTVYAREGCRCTFEMSSEAIVGEPGPWTEYWKTRKMGFDREYAVTRTPASEYDESQVVQRRTTATYWRLLRAQWREDEQRRERRQ